YAAGTVKEANSEWRVANRAEANKPAALLHSLFRDFAIRLLLDLALELEHARRQLCILGLDEEGIEAAAMIDRLESVRRHQQLHRAAERIRHHGDVEQVGQEPPLGLAVRVAHLVSDLRALAGQFASP